MNLFAAIGVLAVAVPMLIVMGILLTAWRAWWLYPAWGWFVVPLGARPIAFWHFAALVFLVTVLTRHVETKKDERSEDWWSYPTMFLWPIVVWAVLRWMAS